MPKPSLRLSTLAPAPPTPSCALLAQFLTRPSKWYARSASAPQVSSLAAAGNEISPRASTSSVANGPSGARRPKISRPTDPRPIFGCGGLYGCAGESLCSVLDLSRPSLSLSPSASTPGSHAKSSWNGGGSPVSISISAPVLAGAGACGGADGSEYGFGGASGGLMGVQGAGGIAPGHVPTRSHSFTLKLSSRLVNLGGASPVERDGRDGKEKEKHSVGFPFHFGGAQSKPLPPDPASLAPPHTHIILEPAPEEEDASSKTTNTTLRPTSTMVDIATAEGKRASQIVYASGFVNRLITPALADPRAWKPFKMEVRGQKLILHKSPSNRAAGVRDLFTVGVVEEPEKEEETDTLAIEDAGAGRGGRGD
ncbi:hypothetical protein B0H14DRAFT_3868325 [Mycena olivaceomarginata]|nr:hypothetical protein B0H14DRAFT_3868325 [Mycena olivaceomarginata]